MIAIKKILSGYGEDDKYIEMLVDEAKIAAELSHPNIVQIYDLGRKDNYYFIAMEYVLGKDLREIQTRLRERDKWFPEEIAIYLTIKILEALNYAHKAKDSRGRPLEIVHRDVSPPNILISYNGDVKLTDFGVSKASIKIHQTLSGALKGKLLYMSPEQACGESTIDYRSDLYSAGRGAVRAADRQEAVPGHHGDDGAQEGPERRDHQPARDQPRHRSRPWKRSSSPR